MESIVMIEGNVDYKITLDPGVWIFDDRKVDIATFFTESRDETDESSDYARAIAKQWEDETRPNPISPPIEKSTKKFEKEKIITGSFGMVLKPFLTNASPRPDAHEVTILSRNGSETTVPLEDAYGLLAAFSKDGKPLKEDGPIHLYFSDGSNKENPILEVAKIIVK